MGVERVWWWIERWRASEAFQTLSLAEQGIHRQLIDWSFVRGGSLPNNPMTLLRMSGAMPREWQRAWPAVSKFWIVTDETITPGAEVRRYVSRFGHLPSLQVVTRRPDLPQPLQRFIYARDRVCVWCGSAEQLELDHITRWRDGGRHVADNLRVLCRSCNRRRG